MPTEEGVYRLAGTPPEFCRWGSSSSPPARHTARRPAGGPSVAPCWPAVADALDPGHLLGRRLTTCLAVLTDQPEPRPVALNDAGIGAEAKAARPSPGRRGLRADEAQYDSPFAGLATALRPPAVGPVTPLRAVHSVQLLLIRTAAVDAHGLDTASPRTMASRAGPGPRTAPSQRRAGSTLRSPSSRYRPPSSRYPTRRSRPTRSWVMVSRSRTVTARSPSESKSTVTQNGVPISSWRR